MSVASASVWFDDRYRPLDLFVLPSEYTYEELDAGLSEMEASYRGLAKDRPSLRVALLVDMSAIQKTHARNRRRTVLTFERMNPVMTKHAVGQAFIAGGAIGRGALTAIFWIKRPPWPVRVFEKQATALEWLRGRFATEGIRMPEPLPWWRG